MAVGYYYRTSRSIEGWQICIIIVKYLPYIALPRPNDNMVHYRLIASILFFYPPGRLTSRIGPTESWFTVTHKYTAFNFCKAYK